jgi:hypothetical protein
MMHEGVTGDGTKVTASRREKKFCSVVTFLTADQLQNFIFSQCTVEELQGLESFTDAIQSIRSDKAGVKLET